MEFFNNVGWFGKSIIAMICVTPFLMLWNKFGEMGVKSEVILSAWFVGCALGMILMSFNVGAIKVDNLVPVDFFMPVKPILLIVLMGIIFGATGNALLSQAMTAAPVPAFAFAIVGVSSAAAFTMTPAVSRIFPSIFSPVSFNWINLLGLILLPIIMGLVIYQPK